MNLEEVKRFGPNTKIGVGNGDMCVSGKEQDGFCLGELPGTKVGMDGGWKCESMKEKCGICYGTSGVKNGEYVGIGNASSCRSGLERGGRCTSTPL
jgi:hypothetical protein